MAFNIANYVITYKIFQNPYLHIQILFQTYYFLKYVTHLIFLKNYHKTFHFDNERY